MGRLLLGLLALALAGCGRNDTEIEPRFGPEPPELQKLYIFGVHPLYSPKHLFEVYGPLIDYLNRQMPEAKFRLEASRNLEAFEKKLYDRRFDFALPNPYETLNALRHGYRVMAKMGDDDKFVGTILVRRDSGIRQVSDLKGKKVAYPAPTAVAAAIMAQYYFQTHGLDVDYDIENVYVGSGESVITDVYIGEADAGATCPFCWEAFQREHPEQARELVARWKTEPLINNSVVARDDVPPKVAERVVHLLSTLHENPEGREILARIPLSRFEPADDARYRPVKDFLRKFAQTVRPLPEFQQ